MSGTDQKPPTGASLGTQQVGTAPGGRTSFMDSSAASTDRATSSRVQSAGTRRKKQPIKVVDDEYEEMAPGMVLDSSSVSSRASSAVRRQTLLDTRNEDDQEHATVTYNNRPTEEMPQQTEVEFPTAIVRESVVDNREPPLDKARSDKPEAEFETRDFANLDPKDYGIEFDEEDAGNYQPPGMDATLPDLYRLMDSLEDGAGDLDGQQEPPSLFTRQETAANYHKISELKMALEEEPIGDYVEEFEEGVRDDVLMIGSISLEEVQEEEKKLRDEHVAYQEQEARMVRDKQQEILVREEQAKKRVAQDLKDKRRLLKRQEEIKQQRERMMMERLHRSFKRAEHQLVSTLERRKGEVRTFYGDLMSAEGHYGGSKGRRWKVDWEKTPQPVQIKLMCLRGVKDKLPAGRYVMMVSLYNRLGGHAMRWSSLKGQQWAGASLPVSHDGHFYNTEMKIDQSVFTVLPSKPGVRPGMTLLFELFLLRGAVVPSDRVVAWGAFPIADGAFDVIEGKYKCPMLRGEFDVGVDKHEKLEAIMATDLDHWMANMYFDIIKLPRYLAGQKEYEVELQFSSGILAFPDRVNIGEEYRDGEPPVPGSIVEVQSVPSTSNGDTGSQLSVRSSSEGSADVKKALPFDASRDEIAAANKKGRGITLNVPELRQRGKRPMSMYGSRTRDYDREVTVAGEDTGSEYEDDDVYLMKKEEDFFPVKGQKGIYYKRHPYNPVDKYHKKLFSLLPKTPLLNQQRRKRKKLTHLEQLEEHTFSVKNTMKGQVREKGWEKVHYIRRQFAAELGLSQWRSREFWGMLLMFVLVFFIRIYIHYIAQWILLTALTIPVNKFDFLPYTVNLNYQNSLLSTREEVGIVLLGPMGNVIIFSVFVLLSFLCQRILGSFPEIGSKLVVSYGIQAFLDPFLILIVDCILQRFRNLGGDNPIADFAKLYWHFYRAEGSGLAGIFITVFLYLFTCFCAGAILYMYFLRLHNNGRMLDIYWRLHGEEDLFFVPYDLEVSNQELNYICKKAEQWRGEEGERRKVAVYDYVWEEEMSEESVMDANGVMSTVTKEGKKEVTTHVALHTLHLDGLRELYRHFLRLPDGAIVEVFGDMAAAGMDKDVGSALVEGAQNLENLMGSASSLHKIPGRQTAFTNAGFNLDEEDTTDFPSGKKTL